MPFDAMKYLDKFVDDKSFNQCTQARVRATGQTPFGSSRELSDPSNTGTIMEVQNDCGSVPVVLVCQPLCGIHQ